MTEIKIYNKSAEAVMTIVRELRAMGLVQGVDFDFAFNQSKWDEMLGEIPKNANFIFYVEKWSSWFALKYGC